MMIRLTLSGFKPTSLLTSAIVSGPDIPLGNALSSISPYRSRSRSTSCGDRYRRSVLIKCSFMSNLCVFSYSVSSTLYWTMSYIVSFLDWILFGLLPFCTSASSEKVACCIAFLHLSNCATEISQAVASSCLVGSLPSSFFSLTSAFVTRLYVSWIRCGTVTIRLCVVWDRLTADRIQYMA